MAGVPTYIAFLRAINVGGRRITGPELCKPFAALGYGDQASGKIPANSSLVFIVDLTSVT